MVVKKRYVPKRGDIVWIDLDPSRGHEQKGKRPAIVLSPENYNRAAGLSLMCPITSHQKGYPFEIVLKVGTVSGVILTDQLRSLDWKERHAEKAGQASAATISEVLKKLQLLLA